jgi:hypothetical protein
VLVTGHVLLHANDIIANLSQRLRDRLPIVDEVLVGGRDVYLFQELSLQTDGTPAISGCARAPGRIRAPRQYLGLHSRCDIENEQVRDRLSGLWHASGNRIRGVF